MVRLISRLEPSPSRYFPLLHRNAWLPPYRVLILSHPPPGLPIPLVAFANGVGWSDYLSVHADVVNGEFVALDDAEVNVKQPNWRTEPWWRMAESSQLRLSVSRSREAQGQSVVCIHDSFSKLKNRENIITIVSKSQRPTCLSVIQQIV